MYRYRSISREPGRRMVLGGMLALSTAGALPGNRARAIVAAEDDPLRSFRMSLSVSPFTEAVLRSVSLTSGPGTAATVRQVQELFSRQGATEMFVRVATLRSASLGDAEYGFAHAVDRARLARDLDLPLNPELGLWAVYGDITSQPSPDFSDYPSIRLPGPWVSLALPQMENALRQYAALVARQILATGVRVNYWDLGNEVEWGVAGVAVRGFNPAGYSPPDAVDPAIGQMSAQQLLGMTEPDRISWLQRHIWPYVGRLLAAVADGVRSVHPAARFSTHISGLGVDGPLTPVAFWEAMNRAGYCPGLFGASFYPTNGDPGDRRAILLEVAGALHRRFATKLFLAEFSYPSGQMGKPYQWNNAQAGCPQTPDGQFRYVRDLVTRAVQAGTVAGIRPWAPDYCTASGGWGPMSLFETDGTAKPALSASQWDIAEQ